MKQKRSFTVDFIVLACILMVFVLGVVYCHTSIKERPKSIWHEGDEVVFRNNGPRMMVIDAEDSSFVICRYYNYVQGNFISTGFKDNQLERVENENNK